MKRIALFAATALVFAPSAAIQVRAADTSPGKVCLNASQIQRTEVPDDRTIIFHMRDGKIWRNTLKTACPMLKISPYTQKLNGDLVCSNQQFIHVVMTGNDCVLGDFTPLPDER
ncbi:MAG TPA: hypothetical protein VGM72_03310 [Micropepsaceae bacterium]